MRLSFRQVACGLVGSLLAAAGARAQGLDGFRLGEPLATASRAHPHPAAADPVDGFPAMRWEERDGSDVAVTATPDTKRVVFIEHDRSGAAAGSPVGVSGLRFGLTLDDIRRRFGSNGSGFASKGVSVANNSLVGVNCYEPAGSDDVTLALVTSQPISDVDPSGPRTGRGRLVAAILARTSYLERIWGKQRLVDPDYHRIEAIQ